MVVGGEHLVGDQEGFIGRMLRFIVSKSQAWKAISNSWLAHCPGWQGSLVNVSGNIHVPLLQLLRKRSVHWKRSTPYRLFLLHGSVCKRSTRLVTFNTKRWNHCWLVILFDRWFGYCNPDLSTRASICRLSVISSSIGLWLFNSILENNFFNSILENNFTWNHD